MTKTRVPAVPEEGEGSARGPSPESSTAPSTDPSSAADVLLSDGALAIVRSLRPDDGPALHDLHDRVSQDTLWFRFFSVARGAAHRYVDHVVTSPDTLALVAEIDGRVEGLATAEPIRPGVYEVAFLVADEHRGRGLGTLLLEHLAAEARDRGIRHFEARVLQSNRRMLDVFTDAGFQVARQWDDGEEALQIDTVVTPDTQAAADRREFAAERHSLAPLLRPKGVVVYGVRRDGTGIGATLLAAIKKGGFEGRVAVVHPRAGRVCGTRSYPTAVEAPGPFDLAVIAVPAEAAVASLEDAARAGVRAVVVVSSGFREMGERGGALQQQLVQVARRHDIRLIGPNCLGIVSTAPETRLHAAFGGQLPASGGLAVASQSGGVGIALMDMMAQAGVGISYFVSLGNKGDVSGNDLLAAWYDDDRVTCGALYLESFGNPRKFARFARTFSERKPLIAVVGGRSAGGRRAGASHTAAAASPESGVRALFSQAGVIECHDAEQLADTAQLLTREPLPAGDRIAIVTNAGGLGVLAADLAADEQLEVVEFSADLGARIARMVRQTTGTTNPVDAGAGTGAAEVAAMTDAVLGSGEVDAVVVVLVATGTNDLPAALAELAVVRRQHPERPLIVVPIGDPAAFTAADVTTFQSSAAALGALGRAVRYSQWRRIRRQHPQPADPTEARRARVVAQRLLGAAGPDGWVAPAAERELLGAYGIDLVGRFAAGASEAAEVATELGFPVAVKLAEPDVVHRTDEGLVRVGLGSAEEVAAAVAGFERSHGTGCAVLVQPMEQGVEVVLGVVRDPAFGPLVMMGAGGVATDLWDDRSFLVPPFHESDVMRVLRTLRVWPLLAGFRGAAPVASDDLAHLAVQLGRLSVDVPEVAEIDLNPVLVGTEGCAVVDAKLRLADAGPGPVDRPSQLRRPG